MNSPQVAYSKQVIPIKGNQANAKTNDSNETNINNSNEGSHSTMIKTMNLLQDPFGPYQVDTSVQYVTNSWSSLTPVHPQHFLQRLLQSRGYGSAPYHIPPNYRRSVAIKDLNDYDNTLVWAIRRSDLPLIASMWTQGTSMKASNQYGESILHQACRRSEFNVVAFILSHGGQADAIDDCGRTPLHDACWRTTPHFGIVTLLMDSNRELIRASDKRGATPLSYCQEKHWLQWCAYFYHQRDRYWPTVKATTSVDGTSISVPSIVPTAPPQNDIVESVPTNHNVTNKGDEVSNSTTVGKRNRADDSNVTRNVRYCSNNINTVDRATSEENSNINSTILSQEESNSNPIKS